MIIIKSDKAIEFMREAGHIVKLTHQLIKDNIKPGITTSELDKLADEFIRSRGAEPSFKNYNGFPCSICVAVNDEVIHGIPSDYKLNDGDIISVDIGAKYKGYHGDSARTFPVGNINEEARRLIEVTRQSFYEGIKFAVLGNRLFDISSAIQRYVESNGYSVVREFVGHGIGRALHEDPNVPNFGTAGKGVRLSKGMTLAIEPMVNQGLKDIYLHDNDWTIMTVDGSLSAHYENTVLITDGMPELLT